MIALRGLGVVLLLIAGAGIGFVLADRYRRRPRELTALRTGLQVLITEIDVGLTPLPQALERAAAATGGQVAALFAAAAALLRAGGGMTGGEAWARALATVAGELALEPAELDILRDLGACLGRSSREDQRRHLELAAARLAAAEQAALASWRDQHRLALYLGVIGAGIVVLSVL
ncbi:MAG TPA: stage III sporulation protein AB [Bacillota bacterium]